MMRQGLFQRSSTFHIIALLLLLLFCAPPPAESHIHAQQTHMGPPNSVQQHEHLQEQKHEQKHIQLLEHSSNLHLRESEQEQDEEQEDDFLVDDDDEVPNPEALHNFVPTLPSSSDVLLGHFNRVLRFLTGSNCVLIERGEVPIYEQCYGCSMREAFACLQDMRNNVTGNVPPGCHIEAISEKPDTSCCPTFHENRDGTFGGVIFESSAYPMAMECLREVGCEETDIFTNLVDECYHVCDGVKNLYNNDIYFTCTAIPSPAATVSVERGARVASLGVALLLALQVLY